MYSKGGIGLRVSKSLIRSLVISYHICTVQVQQVYFENHWKRGKVTKSWDKTTKPIGNLIKCSDCASLTLPVGKNWLVSSFHARVEQKDEKMDTLTRILFIEVSTGKFSEITAPLSRFQHRSYQGTKHSVLNPVQTLDKCFRAVEKLKKCSQICSLVRSMIEWRNEVKVH